MTTPSPSLRAAYVGPLVELLAGQGYDVGPALSAARLEAACLHDAEHKLSLEQLEALFAALTRLTGRSDLGFEMGLRVPLHAHGVLGYGLASCRTYEQVVVLASRFSIAAFGLGAAEFERDARGGEIRLTIAEELTSPALRRTCVEFAAVMMLLHGRRLCGAGSPGFEMWIGQRKPRHATRFDELAPALVHFDAKRAADVTMRLLPQHLDRPVVIPLTLVLPQPAQPASRAPAPEPAWSSRVTLALRALPGAVPGAASMAARLGLSVRTLDRYLAKESLTYRAIARSVLVEHAQELLRARGTSVHDVAARLGFSNAANFTRAFRRATGMTPSEYQAHHHASESG